MYALVEQPLERLTGGDVAQVVQHLVPEPRVQQVQHGVLDAADVQVDPAVTGCRARRPSQYCSACRVDEPRGVGRVQVAQSYQHEPAHCGMVFVSRRYWRGPSPRSSSDVRPSPPRGQRRLRLARRRPGRRPRASSRRSRAARPAASLSGSAIGRPVVVVHDRERLTPVALPGEQPVAQPVVTGPPGRARAPATRPPPRSRPAAWPCGTALVSPRRGDRPSPLKAVGHWLAGTRRRPGWRASLRAVPAPHDRQPECPREFEVALVVAGHRHDRAGAVAHQHVVGDEDRDPLAVDRVDRVRAGEHAGLRRTACVRCRST